MTLFATVITKGGEDLIGATRHLTIILPDRTDGKRILEPANFV
jgi:hypothetical protein